MGTEEQDAVEKLAEQALSGVMYLSLLRVTSGFTGVQEQLDYAARSFFKRRMPGSAEFLSRKVLRRINDEERVDLVLALAKDAGSDADLENFRSVFNSVKTLRDRVAHASSFTPDGVGGIRITGKGYGDPKTVTTADVVAVLRDIGWLQAQLTYALLTRATGFDTPRIAKKGENGEPIWLPAQKIKPTARPEDWDGKQFDLLPE